MSSPVQPVGGSQPRQQVVERQQQILASQPGVGPRYASVQYEQVPPQQYDPEYEESLEERKREKELEIAREVEGEGFEVSNFRWSESDEGWSVEYDKRLSSSSVDALKREEEVRISRELEGEGFEVSNFRWSESDEGWSVEYDKRLSSSSVEALKQSKELEIARELEGEGFEVSNFRWSESDEGWSVEYDTRLNDVGLARVKSEEENRISASLESEGKFAENFVWGESEDGQLGVSYNVFAKAVDREEFMGMDTSEQLSVFEQMKSVDRSALLESLSDSGLDGNQLQFLHLRSMELDGLNTRTPVTWDHPESVAWYQEGVVRS
ncbi:MAG: hypothetical protein LBE76_00785, partial [Nitrososphaerota archaeon]|nr:hypothetical protein [Nitrososphaerota archaeon]